MLHARVEYPKGDAEEGNTKKTPDANAKPRDQQPI